MKNTFSKKLLIPITALLLCAVVVLGTAAVSSQRAANINIYVNADDTVKKYNGSTEDSTYAGLGINAWAMDLGPEAVGANNMTDAYFEINAQRILKQKPKMVRFMVQPYYLCFMDEEDAGEARWNAAEEGYEHADLNYDSAYMYNIWRYLEVYEAAGTQVLLNWGYSHIAPMEEWFAIKDAPADPSDITYGMAKRSAPDNLKAFANNLVAFLKECEDRGFIGETREDSTIQYVTFYNEVMYSTEFTTFGDDAIYWTKMLEYCHDEMVRAGFRDGNAINDRSKHRVMISGMESSIAAGWYSYVTHYTDYVYENAYKKGYCDLFETHQYLHYNKTGANVLTRASQSIDFINYANERWNMTDKGSLNHIMAEMSMEQNSSITQAEKMLGKDGKLYSGSKANFNGNTLSQAIYQSLGGATASLDWLSFGMYWPLNAGMTANGILNDWGIPSKSADLFGVEAVNSVFGIESMFMRYVPENSRVAKSTVEDANKDSVILATYMNGDDTAVVAEFDYKSGFDYTNFKKGNNYTRTVNIHLDGRTEKQYYKYVYEFPEESFLDSDEAKKMYDGNAILPDGVPVTAENGVIHDEISGNHCLVIYSTIAPAQQVGLTKRSREITYSKTGNSAGVRIEVDLDACRQLGDNPEFEFDVYRGVVDVYEEGTAPAYLSDVISKSYLKTDCSEFKLSGQGTTLSKREGEILADGDSKTSAIYKAPDDAKVGDTIAVRVKLKDNKNLSDMIGNENKRLQVYDTDVYAVAIIKIIA